MRWTGGTGPRPGTPSWPSSASARIRRSGTAWVGPYGGWATWTARSTIAWRATRRSAAGGDEEFGAGGAYHVGPGHTPEIFPGTRVVGFSPTAALAETLEVVMRNMEAMGG